MKSERVDQGHLYAVDGLPWRGGTAVWPLVVIGGGLVAGQVWGGLYKLSIWGPVAVAIAVVLVALLVSRPARPSLSAAIVLGALAGLAGFSALSMLWAESAPQASLEAHRWALYAGLFAVLLLLLRDQRQRRVLIISIGAAAAVVVIGMTAILLVGDASSLFFAMRLSEPLGYVNGQAAALGIALWPALAVAEHARGAALRGAGAGLACLVCGLMLLVQSRGATLAHVLAIIFVLALLPGRIRRGWLLVAVGVSLATVAAPLLDVYSSSASPRGQPADGVVHGAVALLLVASVGCGGIWGVATWLAAAQAARGRELLLGRVGRIGLAAIAGAGIAFALVTVGNPVAKLSEEFEQFRALDTAAASGPGQSRLLAGGGNRYDYWRVALEEFRSAPVAGLGAGNYTRDYFRLRRTAEDIRQPHSLELQTLSELGVVGFALVAALLTGLLWCCVVAARTIRERQADAPVVVACCGLIAAWIVHTSVDWLHLLPSLTGVTICAAAALVCPAPRSRRGQHRLALTVVAVGLTVLAAAGIGRLTLADRLRGDARAALAADPAEAVRLADRALRLQGDDVQTLYVRAGALSRQDDYLNARRTLLQAVRAEPHNFVPRALLGDLATRRGDAPAAQASYRVALELNPRNVALREAYERSLSGVRHDTP